MTVFEAARQVDCIQAADRLGLQLKRSGSRRFTRCLFHAENTPSMCLYPDAGGFYCFGCNEHGDVIRLYQQALGIDALEAAKRICADFGLTYEQWNCSKKRRPLPVSYTHLDVYKRQIVCISSKSAISCVAIFTGDNGTTLWYIAEGCKRVAFQNTQKPQFVQYV